MYIHPIRSQRRWDVMHVQSVCIFLGNKQIRTTVMHTWNRDADTSALVGSSPSASYVAALSHSLQHQCRSLAQSLLLWPPPLMQISTLICLRIPNSKFDDFATRLPEL